MTGSGKKPVFSREAAYVCGELLLALGTAFMERAGFGLSQVVAPAYLLHVKVSSVFPSFSFGRAEYCLQALLLLLLALITRKPRKSYLFSFVTAFLYGLVLDGFLALTGGLGSTFPLRILDYCLGTLFCSAGVAFMFETYLTPAAYEFFVKEISQRFGFEESRCKTAYDIASLAVSVVLSFALFGFGRFVGIGWGTALNALINGTIIGCFSRLLRGNFTFEDRLPLRRFFAE